MQFETRKWVLLQGVRSAAGVFFTAYGGLRFKMGGWTLSQRGARGWGGEQAT